MFRKGDKVMFVKDGVIGWESSRYYLVDKLNYNTTYIIEEYDRGCESVLLKDHSLWHHPDHFKLVDEHDQYVVKLTQDEVDTIAGICPVIGGGFNTSRSIFNTPGINPSLLKTSSFCSYGDVCEELYCCLQGGLNFHNRII
jgi:hypothetical protein